MKSPFTYETPASHERIGELYDNLSPIEKLPDGVSRAGFIAASRRADATYAVLIDGRLAGVAFVVDRDGWREMGFAKTAYLTSARRLTFAKSIPALLEDLERAEEERREKEEVRSKSEEVRILASCASLSRASGTLAPTEAGGRKSADSALLPSYFLLLPSPPPPTPPPLYFHTPDGDDRSRDWFIRAGCVQDGRGLRCPNLKEKN